MPLSSSGPETQSGVAHWFERTYRDLGFDYLRAPEAYPIFLQLLGARAGQRLLDVACGPGLLLKEANDRGLDVHGVDLSRTALELAQRYVPEASVHVGNAQEIAHPEGTFDYVTCIAALERFFDRPAALREIRRVGASDARFCFMVRNARTLVWRLWRDALKKRNVHGHQDALDLERWSGLFEAHGFRIEAVYIDQWFRQRLRRALRLFRPLDRNRPEPVARPILPLRYANEFIFILSKGPDPEAELERSPDSIE